MCFTGLFRSCYWLVFHWAFGHSCYCPVCLTGLSGIHVIAVYFSGLSCIHVIALCETYTQDNNMNTREIFGSHVCFSGLFGSHVITLCVSGLFGSHVIALCF